MTTVAATAHGAHAHHDDRPFIRKYIFSTDHKIIGIQFLFVSLFFLLVGGLLAMQMRWQLGFPGKPMPGGGMLPDTMAPGGVLLPEYYIQQEHPARRHRVGEHPDRKSTRLNSSHGYISYAVFCLKKKK